MQQVPLLFSEPVIPLRDSRSEPETLPSNEFHREDVESIGYAPLSSSRLEVRVLELMPGLPWSTLVGKLVRISLPTINAGSIHSEHSDIDGRAQHYEALSYVWGPTTKTEHIDLVDSGQRPITDNLALALRRLRRLDEMRTLWIDAVCINQDDPSERSLQVQLMGMIYSSAARVLVWLGDCNEPREVMAQKYMFQNDVGAPIWRGKNQLIQRNPLDENQDWRIHDLVVMIKNAKASCWWERAWVVQEFVLACYAPVACFGCYEIPWNELRLYMDTIHTTTGVAIGWEGLLTFYRFNEFCSSVKGIMELRDKCRFRFQEAVYTTRRAKATDPRDRIYALRSLVPDPEARAILPHYTKSCADVFMDTTQSLIEAQKSLDILLHVMHHEQGGRLAGLPTWAIDFTFGGRLAKSSADGNMPVTYPSNTQWSPGERANDLTSFDLLQGSLSLRAIRLGTISALVRLPKRSSRFPDQSFYDEASEIQYILDDLCNANPYSDILSKSPDWSAAIGRHVCDPVKLSIKRDWSILSNFDSCGKYCGEFPRVNTTEDILSAAFAEWSDTVAQNRKASYQAGRHLARRNISDWTNYFEFFSGGSMFFTTSQGFIGIAPSSVKAGDVILLPLTSSAPIIVRQVDQGSIFEGLAFVHGVMEGELLGNGLDISAASDDWRLI